MATDGLREALEAKVTGYEREAKRLNLLLDVPTDELRALLAAHPVEPTPVSEENPYGKTPEEIARTNRWFAVALAMGKQDDFVEMLATERRHGFANGQPLPLVHSDSGVLLPLDREDKNPLKGDADRAWAVASRHCGCDNDEPHEYEHEDGYTYRCLAKAVQSPTPLGYMVACPDEDGDLDACWDGRIWPSRDDGEVQLHTARDTEAGTPWSLVAVVRS